MLDQAHPYTERVRERNKTEQKFFVGSNTAEQFPKIPEEVKGFIRGVC